MKKSFKRIVKIRSTIWSLKRKFGKKSRSNMLRPLLWALVSCFNSIIFQCSAGADPGFLERGSYVKRVGSLCCLYLIFLKYPMKMKKIWSHCRLYDKFSYSVRLFYPKAELQIPIQTSLTCWVFFHAFVLSTEFFFFKINFLKESFRNTIRVANSLYADQDRRYAATFVLN